MTRDRTAHPDGKWLVTDRDVSPRDVSTWWGEEHCDRDYATTFSVGEDEGVRGAVVDAVLRTTPSRDVLVVGCGSRVELQEELLARAPEGTKVVATDFARVTAVAEERFSHPNLKYVPLEEAGRLDRRFDVVVAVNVLVMDRDLENRKLLREWAMALRPGGTFVGLTPMLFCGLELAMLSGRADFWESLDLEGSAWREDHQDMWQIEYSPLRLRRILREAGLKLGELRIVFLEGPSSLEQGRVHYDLVDEDLLVYEQLVVATRS